jgi:hypothetical protein
MESNSIALFTACVKPAPPAKPATEENCSQLVRECSFISGQPLALYTPATREDTGEFYPARPPHSKRRKRPVSSVPLVTAWGHAGAEFAGLASIPLHTPQKALTDPTFGLLAVIKAGIFVAPVSNLTRDSVYGGHVEFDGTPGQLCTLRYIEKTGDPVGFLIKVVSVTHGLVCITV